MISGVARAPQAPRPRGARGAEGARQGPARGPPGRSNCRNPLARGPNKLFLGGPKIVATPLMMMMMLLMMIMIMTATTKPTTTTMTIMMMTTTKRHADDVEDYDDEDDYCNYSPMWSTGSRISETRCSCSTRSDNGKEERCRRQISSISSSGLQSDLQKNTWVGIHRIVHRRLRSSPLQYETPRLSGTLGEEVIILR